MWEAHPAPPRRRRIRRRQRPPSPGSRWAIADWRARAGEVLANQIPAWLSRHDADGFPLPFRVRDAQLCDDGLALDIPRGHPWPALEGPASICFSGQATFVGELDHDGANLRVDRMIADLPMVREPHQVFAPEPDTRAALLARLDAELSRRGQSRPVMPEEAPPGSQ